MSNLENLISRLTREELIFVAYHLNFRLRRSAYSIDRNGELCYLCPDSGMFEPIVSQKAKCTSCAQAASQRAIVNAVNEYRRIFANL